MDTPRVEGAPAPRLYEPPGDDEPLDDIQRALVEALLPILIRKVQEALADDDSRDRKERAG